MEFGFGPINDTFENISQGQVFTTGTTSKIYIAVEEITTIDGVFNAVNLTDGSWTFFFAKMNM